MEILSISNANLFEDLIMMSDTHLQTVMKKIAKGDFEGGEVNIKINLSANNEVTQIPVSVDDYVVKEYKQPVISFSVRSTLKQSFSDEAKSNTEGLMVSLEDNRLRLQKVDDGQISLLKDDYIG